MRLLFSKFDEISQIEQERRALQESLKSAQRALDQTLTLIKETQAKQARAHVWAMLSRLKAHTQKPAQKAARCQSGSSWTDEQSTSS